MTDTTNGNPPVAGIEPADFANIVGAALQIRTIKARQPLWVSEPECDEGYCNLIVATPGGAFRVKLEALPAESDPVINRKAQEAAALVLAEVVTPWEDLRGQSWYASKENFEDAKDAALREAFNMILEDYPDNFKARAWVELHRLLASHDATGGEARV